MEEYTDLPEELNPELLELDPDSAQTPSFEEIDLETEVDLDDDVDFVEEVSDEEQSESQEFENNDAPTAPYEINKGKTVASAAEAQIQTTPVEIPMDEARTKLAAVSFMATEVLLTGIEGLSELGPDTDVRDNSRYVPPKPHEGPDDPFNQPTEAPEEIESEPYQPLDATDVAELALLEVELEAVEPEIEVDASPLETVS